MTRVVDPTPGQTPPSLKNAAGLSSDYEYAGIWTGQSNSRPRGYPDDALSVANELDLEDTGIDVQGIVIPDWPQRQVGSVETLVVTGTTLDPNKWNTNTWLRLGVMAFQLPLAPELGYAKVIVNSSASLTVKWISLPANNTNPNGYLVREPPGLGARYYQYEHARVLTPYTPQVDIEAPTQGSGNVWLPPKHAYYPTPNGPLRNGRRLTLPAPWSLPSAVTVFDDLAVFLPITRREGSNGYGISEIADASYAGAPASNPTPHAILAIVGDEYTFANAIAANAGLAGGYLIVDWESGGVSKRSWARIVSNTQSTFTVDPLSWLGDGPVTTPLLLVVTADPVTDRITWTGHPFVEGDRVTFWDNAGTAPGGIDYGRPYFVRNPDVNTFQLSLSMNHSTIDLTTAGTGTITGYQVWGYTAWIAHWRDNPNMWIPGPEFAYPNEDHQPKGSWIYWRARGQLIFVHQWDEDRGNNPNNPLQPFDGVSDSRFGAMLPFAWRVGTALGKRMNMVCLGCNGAPLLAGSIPNYFSYLGAVGWWDYQRFGFGLPLEDSDSQLSKRLKRLITFMAPQALLAEGNAKPLRFVSACHVQGETDSLTDAGRELYIAMITDYKRWLRDLVDSISANPFQGEAEIPFAQPLLTYDPWISGNVGQNPDFQEFGIDVLGFTNNAIREAHTSDPFAAYTITEDIPKLAFKAIHGGGVDNAHFSGQGMVWQGSRLAAAILDLIEFALSFSSSTLSNPRLLRIANLALTYAGQGARQIASLVENTTEARLAALMIPEAVRQLLSMRMWSWAVREEPATPIYHSNPDWTYAYIVPARAVTVIEIIEPNLDSSGLVVRFFPEPGDVDPAEVAETNYVQTLLAKPEPFEIGRSLSGHRVLFTNVGVILGDRSESEVADGQLHPERLDVPPLIRYVDWVVDPDLYSDSFATALSWLLASMLAPALIKGQEGEVVAARCLAKAGGFVRAEATHETWAKQPRIDHRDAHRPSWITGR